MKEKLIAILFPGHCPFCGGVLPPGRYAHGRCLAALPLIREPFCRSCGRPVGEGEAFCADCEETPRSFESGRALGRYEGGLRKAVLDLKFRGRRENAEVLGILLWKYGRDFLCEWGIDVIVPVPMFAKKRRRRGYDQAALLSRVLSRLSGLPLREDLVVRTRETEPLKELGRKEREESLAGAFAGGRGDASGLRILLVDDIFTTGASAGAVSRVLLRNGAASVHFLAVCIATGFMIE